VAGGAKTEVGAGIDGPKVKLDVELGGRIVTALGSIYRRKAVARSAG